MRMYDSLSKSVKDVYSDDRSGASDDDDDNVSKKVKKGLACYTCGPTVYGPAHLGHARTYVWLDVMRRCLEYRHRHSAVSSSLSRPPPLFVMNVTDVDDKILNAASESGESPLELARRYESEFWRDWDALNCLRPHVVTRVTEHVDSDVVPYIEKIVDAGMAYELPGDGLYFDVRAFEERMGRTTRYGKLAPPPDSSDLFTTARQLEEDQLRDDNSKQKKDARDFALWKKQKQGERMYWSSPWGDGRPGWHIECSAMIEAVRKLFGDTHEFDLHCGGIDLKFPHHTNEIAQAEAYRLGGRNRSHDGEETREWIGHWVHTGHLHIDGLKMSKSLKNFVTVHEMLHGRESEEGDEDVLEKSCPPLSSPADDFRLWCLGLSGPYLGPATYSPDRLTEAYNVREKIVRCLLDGEDWLRKSESGVRMDSASATKKWRECDRELLSRVDMTHKICVDALAADLDVSTFISEIVQLVTKIRPIIDSPSTGANEPIRAALKAIRDLLSLLGFSDKTCRAGIVSSDTSASSRAQVVGGERALLDELVSFRSDVRNVAIQSLRRQKDMGSETSPMQEIVRLCDDRRDRVFPSMGVELTDGRIDEPNEDDPSSRGSGWKFCLPLNIDREEEAHSRATVDESSGSGISGQDLHSIALEDLFRVGPYEGQFSEFREDGMPTKNSDGSKVSNRLFKKLQKKRAKHAKRLRE